MPGSPHPANPILLVDDERPILTSLRAALESSGINNIIALDDARSVMGTLESQDIDALLLDLNMPYVSGGELLPGIREEYPELPVIIISGITEVAQAVECMKLGIFDYLTKPVEKTKFLATVGRALEIQDLRHENISLKSRLIEGRLNHPEAFAQIVFYDHKIRSLLMYVESIAETKQIVLITGETGVGKELFAGAIHAISGRKGELVSVNLAGFDEHMFSDALFGHLKGAYTGADRDRPGLIEKAENGTLFLDEIGDLKVESQVKLLRLLESREYYPLGSDVPRRTDARMVVATNRNLEQEVEAGTFRRDLYFRLKTHHIHIPPLLERTKDLSLLIEHFVKEAATELGKPVPKIPPELYLLLKSYPFPGNIRELKSMIFDAVSRHDPDSQDPLPLRFFKAAVGHTGARKPKMATQDYFGEAFQLPTIKESTEMLITAAMKRANRNQTVAARMLGITPQALSQRLKRGSGK